jgi:hypothetical protein
MSGQQPLQDLTRQFAQQPQRQDSLDDQLRDVIALATRAGCYDAADLIRRQFFPEEGTG